MIRPFKSKYINYPTSTYTWTKYHDGGVCLVLDEVNPSADYHCDHVRLSVNMGENYMLRRGGTLEDFALGNFDEIFIKHYSENEGVLGQLIDHDIVIVQRQVNCGFVELPLCWITDPEYYKQNTPRS